MTKVGIKTPGLLADDRPTNGESPCDVEACILVDPNRGPGDCFDPTRFLTAPQIPFA